MIGKAPCYECRDRTADCHGQCGRYREYRQRRLRHRMAEARQSEVNDYESKNSFFRQEGPHGR